MLDFVEKAILRNVLANMQSVGKAMHALQDELKAEDSG